MAQTGPEFPKRQWKLDHLLIPSTWMPLNGVANLILAQGMDRFHLILLAFLSLARNHWREIKG